MIYFQVIMQTQIAGSLICKTHFNLINFGVKNQDIFPVTVLSLSISQHRRIIFVIIIQI